MKIKKYQAKGKAFFSESIFIFIQTVVDREISVAFIHALFYWLPHVFYANSTYFFIWKETIKKIPRRQAEEKQKHKASKKCVNILPIS